MSWYDIFSHFYDASVEKLYVAHRQLALEHLNLSEGMTLLDLPVGTGQSLAALSPALGDGGVIVGVDISQGMLTQARKRVEALELANVSLIQGDAKAITLGELAPQTEGFDRLHIFLGMSAFPDWRETFNNLWSLLKPGGLCVIVDCYSVELDMQGRMVNLIARADLTRPTWEPLEAVSTGFERIDLPFNKAHGGQLFLAKGWKK